MRIVNYSEFRNNISKHLNVVNQDKEITVVSLAQGKNVVLMDWDEYTSLQETLHLTNSVVNRKRIDDAIAEMNEGKFVKHKLVENIK